MWEIRVAVGVDPVTHRTRQRSLTVRGDRGHVEKVRADLVLEAAMSLQDHRLPTARLVTVAELLAGWAVAEHGWRPSTTAGNRSIVRTLGTDPLLAIRVAALTSSVMRATVRGGRPPGRVSR